MVALASSSSAWTVLPARASLAEQRLGVGGARTATACVEDLVGQGDERLALGDEVGLAVELDQGADAVAGVGGDQAVGGGAALALGDALQALDAQDLGGLVAVAVGLVERLLARPSCRRRSARAAP